MSDLWGLFLEKFNNCKALYLPYIHEDERDKVDSVSPEQVAGYCCGLLPQFRVYIEEGDIASIISQVQDASGELFADRYEDLPEELQEKLKRYLVFFLHWADEVNAKKQ